MSKKNWRESDPFAFMKQPHHRPDAEKRNKDISARPAPTIKRPFLARIRKPSSRTAQFILLFILIIIFSIGLYALIVYFAIYRGPLVIDRQQFLISNTQTSNVTRIYTEKGLLSTQMFVNFQLTNPNKQDVTVTSMRLWITHPTVTEMTLSEADVPMGISLGAQASKNSTQLMPMRFDLRRDIRVAKELTDSCRAGGDELKFKFDLWYQGTYMLAGVNLRFGPIKLMNEIDCPLRKQHVEIKSQNTSTFMLGENINWLRFANNTQTATSK